MKQAQASGASSPGKGINPGREQGTVPGSPTPADEVVGLNPEQLAALRAQV